MTVTYVVKNYILLFKREKEKKRKKKKKKKKGVLYLWFNIIRIVNVLSIIPVYWLWEETKSIEENSKIFVRELDS